MRNQFGMLYEILLLPAGFGVLCAVLLPTRYYQMEKVWSLFALMALGMGVALWLSGTVSLERIRLLGLPACAWIFLAFSVPTIPFLLWIQDRKVAILVLAFLPYLSFRLDLWLCSMRADHRRP